MMVINNVFEIGDTAFLVTDPDQRERLVVGITIRQASVLLYELAAGADTSWHYEYELTAERDITKATTS